MMIRCKNCKTIFDNSYVTTIPPGTRFNSSLEPLYCCPICSETIPKFELTRTSKGSGLNEYCSNYDNYAYPDKPNTTVDCVILRYSQEINAVEFLAILRKDRPFANQYALPGGFVDSTDNTIYDAALRELREETSLDNITCRQLKTRGSKTRDPRSFVISTAYIAIIRPDEVLKVKAKSDAKEYKWLPFGFTGLAFDHDQFILDALRYLIDYPGELFAMTGNSKDEAFVSLGKKIEAYYVSKHHELP